MLAKVLFIGRFMVRSFLRRHGIAFEGGAERDGIRPRSRLKGFGVLKWRGGQGHEARDGKREHSLRLWWNLFDCDLRLGLHRGHDCGDAALRVEVGLPPVNISLNYNGDMPMWWRSNNYSTDRSLELRFSPLSWFLHWNLWMHPDIHDRADPRWRRRTIELRDAILGDERVKVVKQETRDLGIPLPGGIVAPVRVTEICEHIDRPRWPFKRFRQRYEVKCSEAAYQHGIDDQAFHTRVSGGWPEAIGQIVEHVTRKRYGVGGFAWKPGLKHCPKCKGLGLAPKCCEDCKGLGRQSLAEVVRLAIQAASVEVSDEVSHEVRNMVADRGAAAVQQLVEVALEARQQNENAVKAGGALLSAAVCFLRLGRLGEAAEAAAMAFGRGAELRHVEAAQRLLSILSRIPLPAVPLWKGMNILRFKMLSQPMPEGIIEAIPLWEVEPFLLLLRLDEQALHHVTDEWRVIGILIDDLELRAERAGWTRGEPLGMFVERLRAERNTACDSLDEAFNLLGRSMLISIPEGSFGDPMRELFQRIGGFLRQQGRLLHPDDVKPAASEAAQ